MSPGESAAPRNIQGCQVGPRAFWRACRKGKVNGSTPAAASKARPHWHDRRPVPVSFSAFQPRFPRSDICSSGGGGANTKKHKCTLCYSVSASQRALLQQCLHPDCLQISTSTDIYTLFLYYLLPPTACHFPGFQVHTNKIYSYLKQCKTLNATFLVGVGRWRGVGKGGAGGG